MQLLRHTIGSHTMGSVGNTHYECLKQVQLASCSCILYSTCHTHTRAMHMLLFTSYPCTCSIRPWAVNKNQEANRKRDDVWSTDCFAHARHARGHADAISSIGFVQMQRHTMGRGGHTPSIDSKTTDTPYAHVRHTKGHATASLGQRFP
jgi:hypothetical protein